ncbi:MAG: MOSC domain-containing protein [Betaproteobacteria bacterium]|nr:MOSC domain-containing protein [Betaproteobacteria bacterium]
MKRITGLFIGSIATLEPEGQPTGIFKHAVAGPVQLTRTGLAGDVQADRRVHGGPEKAVHHYAAENYLRLAADFPQIASALVPGSLGENISTTGWDEESICIGDIFRLGAALVQVSQPRSPCWKIDRKFSQTGLTRFIAEHGVAGWYYRVLEEAMVAPDDAFELQERPAPDVTLARLWRASIAHRPTTVELDHLLAAPGLAPNWIDKLAKRRDWLAEQLDPELP